MILVGVQLLLGILEHRYPARRDWMQPAREKLTNISIVLVVSTGTVMVALWYNSLLAAPLQSVRQALHLDIWPRDWPVIAQLFLVFFLSEFLWYWTHRAEHRWPIVWDRLFGTFEEGPIVEAGTGPTEPNLWEKVMMPFKEPADTAIAPRAVRR